jgi:heme/copper-type cytochrome/quinol oxidase subunit 4
VVDHEVTALVEDYRRVSTHITEYAKLQYQLIGVAYAIVGAALALWGSSTSQLQPLLILFFPPVFCAIVLVQLYLHSSIKSLSRYINFRLRPRMEAIINSEHPSTIKPRTIWGWEEYYVQSHRIPRFIIRQLGSVIIFLALLPGIGALLSYWLIASTPWPASEQVWFTLDAVAVFLTFALIVFVKMVNEHWWRIEKEQLAKQQLSETHAGRDS